MNDFTKQELSRLLSGLYALQTIQNFVEIELIKKVEEMINNYCEHKWQAMCDNYDPCNPECMVCQKCHIALKEYK